MVQCYEAFGLYLGDFFHGNPSFGGHIIGAENLTINRFDHALYEVFVPNEGEGNHRVLQTDNNFSIEPTRYNVVAVFSEYGTRPENGEV